MSGETTNKKTYVSTANFMGTHEKKWLYNSSFVVQPKVFRGYPHCLTFRLDDQLFNEFQRFKQEHHFRKDSEIIRIMIKLGMLVIPWMKQEGLWTYSTGKAARILEGLSREEKLELFELLAEEMQGEGEGE